MKIRGLPTALFDETYLSWLIRCSLDPWVDVITESDIDSWDSHDAPLRAMMPDHIGMDFDLNGNYAKRLTERLSLDVRTHLRSFRSTSELLLASEYRTAYCHLCITEDVSSGRYPAWRKSWCYSISAICGRHQCLLSHLNYSTPTEKQWDAYKHGELGDFLPSRRLGYSRRHHGLKPSRARSWLTLRVQNWLAKLECVCTLKQDSNPHKREAENLLNTVHYIFKILLTPRTSVLCAGIARDCFTEVPPKIFHNSMNFSKRLRFGAAHCVPYERMCALLLLGKIFMVFSRAEQELLDKIVSEAEFYLPSKSIDLGRFCSPVVSTQEYEELKQAFVLSNDVLPTLGDFLDGLLSESWKNRGTWR